MVTGAVIGDNPLDAVDAVGGEEDAGPVHESDCRDGLLVIKGFGVGESGIAIDRRMQVHVAGAGARGGGPFHGSVAHAVAAMDAPSAAVGDPPHFLDVDVDHRAGPARHDRLRHPQGVSVGVDEPATVEP